jgi:hypothetical protein
MGLSSEEIEAIVKHAEELRKIVYERSEIVKK